MGAQDCIPLAALDVDSFAQTLWRAVERYRHVTALRKALRHARHRSTHDSLTGLPNRTLFDERLAAAVARSVRSVSQLAVAYVDLDGFKSVNDEMGHAVGDALLRRVAKRLKRSVRAGDTTARLGGDEFALILEPVASDRHAAAIAQTLLTRLSEPVPLADRTFRLTASIGIALYPRDGETPRELLKKSDRAMYASKARKNGYSFCKPEHRGSRPKSGVKRRK